MCYLYKQQFTCVCVCGFLKHPAVMNLGRKLNHGKAFFSFVACSFHIIAALLKIHYLADFTWKNLENKILIWAILYFIRIDFCHIRKLHCQRDLQDLIIQILN